jgi:Cohesin domain
MNRESIFVSAVLLACLLASGCGGSDYSGSSTGLHASFTAEQSAPGPASVSLEPGRATGDTIEVRVRLTDIGDVYGAAFYVVLDPVIASYVSYAAGEVLESDGQVPLYLVDAGQPGRIVVSANRLGPVGGVDVTGSRTLLTLTLRVVGVGVSGATFDSAALYDSQLQPQPMPGIHWFGGEIVGR